MKLYIISYYELGTQQNGICQYHCAFPDNDASDKFYYIDINYKEETHPLLSTVLISTTQLL